MSKPLYAYWKLRGIGHPIKLVLEYLNVDHDVKYYDLDQNGFNEWSEKDKQGLGLDFPNLPYWIDNGMKLTESRAILKSIAREKGNGQLMPKSNASISEAEMIENVLWDILWALVERCLVDTEEKKKSLIDRGYKKMEYISKFLGDKKWLLGSEICYVDFLFYEILYHYTVHDKEYPKPFPNFQKFRNNFEAIPSIAKYIASDNYVKGPCYHPMFVKHKI